MDNISGRTSFLAKIALFIVAILWGTSLTVVKSAADVFKPNFLLGIRFTLAGIILAVVFHKKLFNAKRNVWINMGIGTFTDLERICRAQGLSSASAFQIFRNIILVTK